MEALKRAESTAVDATNAEVFIFHQEPGTTRMFWNVPGGVFAHYRHGRLVRRQRYSSASDPRDLAAEAALYRTHADDYAQPARILAYFGHEISPDDNPQPGEANTGGSLTTGRLAGTLPLWGIASDGAGKPFDLVILSTYHGGTPRTLEALALMTDLVVASPASLHLSHLDMRAIARYRPDTGARGARAELALLANQVAAESFERLSERTQTEVTVAVYDLEAIAPFLREQAGRATRISGKASGKAIRWRDCAVDPSFDASQAANGVSMFYRAPRFGPGRDIASRSAWQCPY
jgi:hypothetical protein